MVRGNSVDSNPCSRVPLSAVESIQDKLKGELGLQYYTQSDTRAKKEYGERKHSFAPPSSGNQGIPLEATESPAAEAQESQGTIHSFRSSPSTPSGHSLGHAFRHETLDVAQASTVVESP
jgi:hypothetical protein